MTRNSPIVLSVIALAGVAGLSPARSAPAEAKATTFSIQADEAPDDKPWEEPARLAYTVNMRGRDSFSVDVAAKLSHSLSTGSPVFGTTELVWHKNNQQKKEQDDLRAAVGLHLDIDTISATGPLNENALSLFVDANLSYGRKAVFPDTTTPACVASPSAVYCKRQYVESIRGTLDLAPFKRDIFESDQPRRPATGETPNSTRLLGPPLAYSFGLFGTAFFDDVTRNAVDPDDGTLITGMVSGLHAKAGIAMSPKLADYRLVLRLSGEVVKTLSRGAGRESDFPKSSHLLSASLDYDLVQSSLLDLGPTFRPSVGVTYTNGSDPLAGRKKQSTIVVALKIAFK